jgi:hypothetical protein
MYIRGRDTIFDIFSDERNQANNPDRGPRWIVYSRDPGNIDPSVAFPVVTQYKVNPNDTILADINWRYIQIRLNR